LSYKNLDAIIGATHPQLPKYVAKAITLTKTRSIIPLEMGKESLANELRELVDIPKNLTLKIFQIHEMKVLKIKRS
jgi:hypothetical protein